MMLFRRQPEPEHQEPPAGLQFGPTKDALEAITDFIQLRLALITPPMFPEPDDTGRAVRALGGVAASARVMAECEIDQGHAAILEWVILRDIAAHWRDHPDYQQQWDTIA
ncbi:hypothetical protein E6W39_24285 [Kitasatospora acidiphila]|uniref:Uncharacterized protein n=1 Tax=Kitasatospora acidiphila TaxID=2567942 RepID=A0A540W8S7_9ACTN|nr:hypothetical protein [Kitasatospora acidiphila]TQF04774.1 hypothetical protein E6W39_24285 [Kitasatospora acidiphila]